MLQKIFFDLAGKYTNDPELLQTLWSEIDKKYSGVSRHYHTLLHLEEIIAQLEEVKDKIADWDSVQFAIFYHDIIYKATRANNEEKSAELASRRLGEIEFPGIAKCAAMILATKKHEHTGDNDTELFTDADLSILGQSWEKYSIYVQQIRKEYSIYPDLIYRPGRRKILDHFLQMNRIYKSDYFYRKLEVTARKNIERERELYTGK